jgi:hypothetical protein
MDNLHQTGLGSLVHKEKETFHDDMVPRESSAVTPSTAGTIGELLFAASDASNDANRFMC